MAPKMGIKIWYSHVFLYEESNESGLKSIRAVFPA